VGQAPWFVTEGLGHLYDGWHWPKKRVRCGNCGRVLERVVPYLHERAVMPAGKRANMTVSVPTTVTPLSRVRVACVDQRHCHRTYVRSMSRFVDDFVRACVDGTDIVLTD
jgi:hypothetical protein